MATRQIAIRLGTEGKAQVVADLDAIGSAGDASAKRLANSYIKASRDADQALEFAARQAAKLSALLPGLNPTKLDMAAGIRDTVGKSAESSAAIFSAAYADMEKRAVALRAAIDPAFGAQQRFDREMAEARTLISAGAISLDDYVAKLRQEQAALDAVSMGHGRGASSAGAQRAALQQLSFQTQDVFTQLSMGANVFQVLAIQGGQAAGAFAMVEGKAGAVGRFLIGPWGLAITAALLVLGPLVGKLLDFSNATDDVIDKLKKDAAETEATRIAKDRFGRSVEGVRAAIRDQAEALDKAAEQERSAAERANISAKTNLAREIAIRSATAALLEQAIAQEAVDRQRSQGPGQRGELGTLALTESAGRVGGLQAQLAQNQALIDSARQNLMRSRVDLAAETAKTLADPIARITKFYDDQARAAKLAADAEAKRGGAVTASLTRELVAIEQRKNAAIEAERQRQSEIKKTAKVSQDADTLTAAAVAKMLRGALPGVHVTSTTRSSAENARVGGAANSYHTRGSAVDFVPAGGMSSMTKDDVRRIFESRGIDVVELLGPGDKGHSDHFHVAWTKGKQALDEFSDAAKRAEERKRDLQGLTDKFDPAAAAADAYRVALAKIAALDPPNADALKAGAWAAYAKARAEGFTLDSVEGNRPAYEAQDKSDKERVDKAKEMADYRTSVLGDQRDAIALSQRELQLVGANDNYREAEIEKLRLALDIRRRFPDMARADVEELLRGVDAHASIVEQLHRQEAAWTEIQNIGGNAIDRLFDISSADSWWDRVKGILGDLQSELVKLALVNPLKNALFGQSNSTLSDISKLWKGTGSTGNGTGIAGDLGKLFGQGNGIPKNAAGTEYFSGGATWIAENGPEIVSLPTGSRVTPAGETRRLLAANDSATNSPSYHFDLRGAVMTEDLLRQMDSLANQAAVRGAIGGAQMSATDGARARRRRLV